MISARNRAYGSGWSDPIRAGLRRRTFHDRQLPAGGAHQSLRNADRLLQLVANVGADVGFPGHRPEIAPRASVRTTLSSGIERDWRRPPPPH